MDGRKRTLGPLRVEQPPIQSVKRRMHHASVAQHGDGCWVMHGRSQRKEEILMSSVAARHTAEWYQNCVLLHGLWRKREHSMMG